MNLTEIKKVAMIGAGTMGAGGGLCFAQAGYEVVLYSRRQQSVEQCLERIRASQATLVGEAVISAEDAEAARQRISTTTDLAEALDGTQYVLESAPENLPLKQELFQQMSELCAPDTILTSNTSGLSVSAIAERCTHPERVGGMHWANPAELVPLVEVIRGAQTSDATIETIYQVTEKLGKVPVLVNKEVPGFISNRLQFALLREALHLVDEGVASPEDIDRALKNGVGFRYSWLGPMETADLGGLDIFHKISTYLFAELSKMDSPPDFFTKLIESGNLGLKTGSGFYDYSDASKEELLRQRDLYFIRKLKLRNEARGEA